MKLLQLLELLGASGLTVGVLFLSAVEIAQLAIAWWKRRTVKPPPPPVDPRLLDATSWEQFLRWRQLRQQGEYFKQQIFDIANHERARRT